MLLKEKPVDQRAQKDHGQECLEFHCGKWTELKAGSIFNLWCRILRNICQISKLLRIKDYYSSFVPSLSLMRKLYGNNLVSVWTLHFEWTENLVTCVFSIYVLVKSSWTEMPIYTWFRSWGHTLYVSHWDLIRPLVILGEDVCVWNAECEILIFKLAAKIPSQSAWPLAVPCHMDLELWLPYITLWPRVSFLQQIRH